MKGNIPNKRTYVKEIQENAIETFNLLNFDENSSSNLRYCKKNGSNPQECLLYLPKLLTNKIH